MTHRQPGRDGTENPVAATFTTSPLQERIPARRVALLTGLSVRTVQAWSETGKNGFPSGIYLPDAGWFFIQDEIREWLAVQETKAAAARSEADARSA